MILWVMPWNKPIDSTASDPSRNTTYCFSYNIHRIHKDDLDGNCHELRMHLSKFVCGNMPGFLATFRSRNLLFCLELSLSPPKARYMRAVLPCIDAALNQT